jgi:hypothetical protein
MAPSAIIEDSPELDRIAQIKSNLRAATLVKRVRFEDTFVDGPVQSTEDGESNNSPFYTQSSIRDRIETALKVLTRYRIGYQNDWDKVPSFHHVTSQIEAKLASSQPINMVLPAFPFKSSNRSKKVLSPYPDEAERVSLLHLENLCRSMEDALGVETSLTIVSDGIMYNGNITLHTRSTSLQSQLF